MSSQYNTFYEMSYIPCNRQDQNKMLEEGRGTVNIDGKVVTGGLDINGNYIPPKHTIMYMGNFGISYASRGASSATTSFAARSARANHL